MLNFNITRDKIPLTSVDASYMATPEIAYIRISQFAANTYEEYTDTFMTLKEKGMKAELVLTSIARKGGEASFQK